MRRASLISRLRVWETHERTVLATVDRALELLKASPELHRSETHLNRALYLCLLRANRERVRNGLRGLNSPPTPEGANAPCPPDAELAPREKKIPDFQFSYLDDLEPDPDASAKHFCVECKRLGPPERKDYVFTLNYVDRGVMRFYERSHGYGMGAETGAMVGYVQGAETEDLLREVNERATTAGIEPLSVTAEGVIIGGITQLEHSISRDFHPSPFRLLHRWIDIRVEASMHRQASERNAVEITAPPSDLGST